MDSPVRGESWMRLTEAYFRIYPGVSLGTSMGGQSIAIEPFITIFGMYDGRAAPASLPPPPRVWTAHGGKGLSATARISADVFLKAKLLPVLAKVNAWTTLLPLVRATRKGLQLRLKSWEEEYGTEDEDCPFDLTHGRDGLPAFEWAFVHSVKSGDPRDASKLYGASCVYIVMCSFCCTLTLL
jgi:hypothetical protein